MLEDITVGTTGTLERLITEEYCTTRGDYQIFSTPDLVLLLEAAAIEALAPHLPEHQSSVGTTIDIAHSAATLKGQTVTCTATVTEVDRRRIVFDIVATDGIDTVCTGSHERFVVDLEKFGARLAEKAEKVASS
ncbi:MULTISPECIES: thioesterase family protein [unclassified Nocardioides]|jgi:fluoroacetyl-CoA thioesterase|uniref:thioesterase family protein n=1 Tax=unclassified Nocardioides TaxID=2615069 RepID=UPI0009F0DC3F|nr:MULTISPECIES: thioesterase family protein [unclassified Nocardioides]GAW48706.1 Thioesterase superfamily protein [Nocardioides sp. PD653-B2]GAW54343.1 Thioesterase superfamily protein [Nocardioides sp. PD653]